MYVADLGAKLFVAFVVVAAYAGIATGVLLEKFLRMQINKRAQKQNDDTQK